MIDDPALEVLLAEFCGRRRRRWYPLRGIIELARMILGPALG